jgi:hypothetical protein
MAREQSVRQTFLGLWVKWEKVPFWKDDSLLAENGVSENISGKHHTSILVWCIEGYPIYSLS